MDTPARKDESDETLMNRVVDGDLQALETLVRRYERQLFAYAARSLGDRHQASDAFLKVFQKKHTYRRDAPFRPWVYRICQNVCRDHFRRRQRRTEVGLDQVGDPSDSAPGPAESLQKSVLARKVRSAVESLPEKMRSVFLLVHYQELSHPEASEVLEIPLGTVKSRMHHAFKKLAEKLVELKTETR